MRAVDTVAATVVGAADNAVETEVIVAESADKAEAGIEAQIEAGARVRAVNASGGARWDWEHSVVLSCGIR